MRSAVVQMPYLRTANERRQVLRTGMRQLERADAYVASVANMELGDWEIDRSLRRIRHDIEQLRQQLAAIRTRD
jgi:hypothetical protein